MQKSLWYLIVSDVHSGSAYAIWNPTTLSSNGVLLNPNKGQQYLYDNFEIISDTALDMAGGKLDGFIVDGDAINGPAQDRKCEQNVEVDLFTQGRSFVGTIGGIRNKADRFLMCKGSRWHVGEFDETENSIGLELGAEKDGFGRWVWDWIPALDVNGVILDISHHQSYTLINRTMTLERELRFAAEIADLKPFPDMIIRAHAHIQVEVDIENRHAIGLPPLQLQTPFAKVSKTPNRMIARWLGAALLEIRPHLKGTALSAVLVHWLRFKHPPLYSGL